MKYKILDTVIPQNKRKEINDKIIYLINNGLCEQYNITPEIIFNSYSGDGGLHGLNFKDYDSFHNFTEAKKQVENGQFFTPHYICKFVIDCIKPAKTDIITDMTSGIGNFANYLPVEENIYLNELDMKAVKVMKILYPNANITADDIRNYNPKIKFDIVLGNPPFNLKWRHGKDEYLSQLYYCIKAFEVLKPAGLMVLIVPNSFLNDEFFDKGMINQIDEKFNYICQFNLPKDAFKNVGVDTFETKVMIFQKKSEYLEENKYNTNKISINEFSENEANRIYYTYIKPTMDNKNSIKGKLFFENLNNNDNIENKEFAFQVKKYLFDIKRHPKLIKYYAKCEEYVNKYYTHKCPEGMKFDEWEKVKITKNKVITYLKQHLKKQHEKEQDKIQLVKTNYGLKLKGYSQKNKIWLSKYQNTKYESFNDMVIYDKYPFEDKKYYKLWKKKRRKFLNQNQNYSSMREDENIKNFLDNLVINDSINEKEIRLNDIQKEDTNKALQKNYGFLQWERGCGKTITGTSQAIYRLKNNDINNVVVIAPAIAIKGTWLESMQSFGYEHILITKLEDFKKIKKGQIILMTLYVVNKYKKQIKKMLKINNKKYMLVFDESDAITNLNSQTYKSVLSCFRRLVRYKLLLTGTSTRNNINEFYGQLELLYNNSINMLSSTPTIFETVKKSDEITEISNPYYNQFIPAYKKGYNIFKSMFSPAKVTVFGIGKNTQDIYNSIELKELLSYTLITRTFKEVTGREGYKIHQKLCSFNQSEIKVYDKIINEFYELERQYFGSTGNSRKDAMFRALHQLNLLLQACARFHTFKEYEGQNISTKFTKIIKHIGNLSNERIAIGCVTKKSVWEYQRQLQKHFPNRKIIAFTGEDLDIYQRKVVIKELKEIDNAILITTQQSLSCSLNIGFIDKIIIPELQFNDARMGQYYFRFIRYDSLKDKDVYIYTYENSIESNLMKLVMVKEKINLFMKDQELTDDEINEKYGITFDILNMLLHKERDEEGKTYIHWGEQKII
jgi:predicted RNA methylase